VVELIDYSFNGTARIILNGNTDRDSTTPDGNDKGGFKVTFKN
jgi:hypothetical protein